MIDVFLRKLRARHAVSDEEERVLRGILNRERRFEARQTIVHPGVPLNESMCLLEGFTGRVQMLKDGERQLLELNLAGDFVDLHAFVLKSLDHALETLSDCRMAIVSHADLQTVTEQHPRLARLLWFQTALDAAIHRAWVTSLGRRTAMAAFAHLFCEIKTRLDIVGLTSGDGFPLPMTQCDLADIAGLSAVHTNRSLQALRAAGLLKIGQGQVEILDFAKLAKVAEFDPGYLFLGDNAAPGSAG